MKNNRLSTSSSPFIDRDLLLRDLKVILEGGSSYEHNAEGQIVIKSSGKLLKKGTPIRVLILPFGPPLQSPTTLGSRGIMGGGQRSPHDLLVWERW